MSAKPTKTTSPGADAKAPAAAPAMDWGAFDALTDEDIRAAVAKDPDAAPILGPEWFQEAEVVLPGRKRPISIRLDEEVLNYFQASGEGYQSRINAVLKHYVRTKRRMEALRGLAGRAPRQEGKPARRASRNRKR